MDVKQYFIKGFSERFSTMSFGPYFERRVALAAVWDIKDELNRKFPGEGLITDFKIEESIIGE